VLCMRYLLENLDEQAILAIDAQGDVANCAVTEYAHTLRGTASNSLLELKRYNFVAPLEREGTTVTAEPDANTAVR
jgi:probable phosphoglycerate mutase